MHFSDENGTVQQTLETSFACLQSAADKYISGRLFLAN